ncbi:hypothetical protein [Lysinibacillus sphaericus]|uniref:hypothetical protein n=1 Tax=Lysinibacillus sphaericus TaxID=1421 RepID=UPI001910F430|nr:hypothetical protein [Lysinibacillus sphaericus]QPA56305.1 hypothetical protein INQ53_10090 [Lysinibacillus sphaericus]
MIRMYLDVVMRLSALGVALSSAPSSSDDMLLKHAIDKVTNHINSQTNLLSIPKGLKEIAIDMVVGEFLLTKKAMGLLDVETLNFGVVAKQVQDGDTNTVFAVEAGTTPEAQFNAFMAYLRHNEVDFVRYRVLSW